jgi:hypothetical protein
MPKLLWLCVKTLCGNTSRPQMGKTNEEDMDVLREHPHPYRNPPSEPQSFMNPAACAQSRTPYLEVSQALFPL